MPSSNIYNTFRQEVIVGKLESGIFATTESLLKSVLLLSPTNVLILSLIPAAICYIGALSNDATVLFCLLAIIPLSERTVFAADCLNAIFQSSGFGWLQVLMNSIVDFAICFVALSYGLKRLVFFYVIGSSLLHTILITGFGVLHSGILHRDVRLHTNISGIHSMLLVFFSACLASPEVLYSGGESSALQVAGFSRAAALISLAVYVSYVIFQGRTHSSFFKLQEPLPTTEWTTIASTDGSVANPLTELQGSGISRRANKSNSNGIDRMQIGSSPTVSTDSSITGGECRASSSAAAAGVLEWDLNMLLFISAFFVAFLTLFVWATVMFTATVGNVTDSVLGLPLSFIAAIIFPLVSHWHGLVTAFQFVSRGKVSDIIQMSLTSSIQITLFVFPILIIIAWMANIDLTYCIGSFESATLFLVALVSYAAMRIGECNWFVGALMILLYFNVMVAFWARDADDLSM